MHTMLCSTHFLFLIIIFVSVDSQFLHRRDDEKFQNCEVPFECGPTKLTYPFWGNQRIQDCGRLGFKLKCQDNSSLIDTKPENYRVLPINPDHVLLLQMNVFDSCQTHETLVNVPHGGSAPDNQHMTFLFNCDGSPSNISHNFTCHKTTSEGFYVEESAKSGVIHLCKERILVPFSQVSAKDLQLDLPSTIRDVVKGFKLVYKEDSVACFSCVESHGQCGYDWDKPNQPICFYRHSGKGNRKWKLGLGLGCLAILTSILSIYIFRRRYTLSKPSSNKGGYGSVYKGKLQDGKFVAVKVLNNPKSNGEEFINEVASISRTSHVNIVALSGFCFEGSKRALVYEFMPNGSLEKFIYNNNSSISDRQLGWKSLYQISLGIARGLEYLHRGCKTRIVHFDIKPHNILLDEDFCPKISDFGLSKLCPGKDSIISMTGARGTPGYIAPEVFCRNFGEVSHKSDVYSYGMMVLEMVGGRKNIDVGVDRISEIYFPHWIYKRLELHDELGLQGIANEEDKEFARKMIIVSLWCIQTNPSSRPPMSEVVGMLEGSLESLQIPPQPFLSSPSRSPADSSTTKWYHNFVIL